MCFISTINGEYVYNSHATVMHKQLINSENSHCTKVLPLFLFKKDNIIIMVIKIDLSKQYIM